MYRKKAERKKNLLKEKKSLAQAAEMRKKRLQELYRKQKEAIGKKPCPDEMHKPIGKTGSAKGNPQCELEQVSPEEWQIETPPILISAAPCRT